MLINEISNLLKKNNKEIHHFVQKLLIFKNV